MSAPETLEEIRSDADGETYPREAIAGCSTALVLFAAGFLGRQDAYWVAVGGLQATCIDTDADKLDAMAEVYPTDWDFLEANVYEWAPAQERHWDLVSADCPTGHFERCAELLPVFCRLARKVVVLGCGANHTRLVAPQGWRMADLRHRSNYAPGGVYWAVLEAE